MVVAGSQANAYTEATRIVGVEINDYFCGIQNDTIKRFKLAPRVSVRFFFVLLYGIEPSCVLCVRVFL
jgi:hypothetical protein